MKTKITPDNLTPFVGRPVQLYCQVGVMFQIVGTLVKGCGLCQWGIKLDNGDTIGFSFGQFEEASASLPFAAFIQIS